MTIDQHSLDKIGRIASARVVNNDDEITLITSGGQALRLKVSQVATTGRSTRGVHLINLAKDDTLVSIARITTTDMGNNDGGGE
jgi:DNA gyrase subunit A